MKPQDKTHCKSGHEFTNANTYRTPEGFRKCRTCQKENVRVHRLSGKHKILREINKQMKLTGVFGNG
jgi:hypothetical protein